MATVRIDVYADFVCPHCYLTTLGLEKLRRDEGGVQLFWHTWPVKPPAGDGQAEAERERVAVAALEQYGVTIKPGPLGIKTYDAHLTDKYGDAFGNMAAMHAGLVKAYWREGRNLEERAVLQQVADDLGLDGNDMLSALDNDPSLKKAIDDDLTGGRAYGIKSAPALVFGERFMISGAQSYAQLQQLVAKVRAAQKA